MSNWKIKQLDVKNTFLHGDLKETIYMEQPLGFQDVNNPHHVCLLKKSLYGLKQAPRAWFDKFSTCLMKLEFRCSQADSSMFVYNYGKHLIIILVYVDDVIIIGSNAAIMQSFIDKL